MSRIREVRKRDNRIVPYDQSKVAEAIWRALKQAGQADKSLAEDLASCVSLFLEKQFGNTIPNVTDVQDMIEVVLRETGHHEVAKLYSESRRARQEIKRKLRVHKDTHQGPQVQGGTSLRSFPWEKTRIVAALVKEAELEYEVAREIADSVEEKVFRSGLQSISTSLIRELVDNELFERGFATKLKKQAPIGLPKYDLEQVIYAKPWNYNGDFYHGEGGIYNEKQSAHPLSVDPEAVALLLAGQIFKRYALEELFSSEVAEAAKEGKIILHCLEEPLKLYRAFLGLENFFSTEEPNLSVSLVKAIRSVQSELTLKPPPKLEVLHQISLLNYPHRKAVLQEESSWKPHFPFEDLPGRFKEAFRSLRFRVLLRPSTTFEEEFVRQAALLYTEGFSVQFVPYDPAYLSLVPAKVSLNLPLLALNSGRSPLGDFEGELQAALSIAGRALLEAKNFLQRISRLENRVLAGILGAEDPVLELESGLYAVGIFGLWDAVKLLTGREAYQSEENFAFGTHILEELSRRVRREAQALGIELFLEETLNSSVLREAARCDGLKYPEVAEIFRGRGGGEGYSPGVRFHSEAPLDPLTRNAYLSRIFPFVSLCSIVEEMPELRAAGPDLVLSLLEESWALFEEASGSKGRGPVGTLPESSVPTG